MNGENVGPLTPTHSKRGQAPKMLTTIFYSSVLSFAMVKPFYHLTISWTHCWAIRSRCDTFVISTTVHRHHLCDAFSISCVCHCLWTPTISCRSQSHTAAHDKRWMNPNICFVCLFRYLLLHTHAHTHWGKLISSSSMHNAHHTIRSCVNLNKPCRFIVPTIAVRACDLCRLKRAISRRQTI